VKQCRFYVNPNPDSIIEYALSNQVVDLPAVTVTKR